jgi:hypothetical protein
MYNRVNEEYQEHYGHHEQQQNYPSHAEHGAQRANVDCQITRSSSKWSHNISTEVSRGLEPCETPTHKPSTRFKTHISRQLGMLSISYTLKTSFSSQPQEISNDQSRTKSVRLWSNVLSVLLAMARSSR